MFESHRATEVDVFKSHRFGCIIVLGPLRDDVGGDDTGRGHSVARAYVRS